MPVPYTFLYVFFPSPKASFKVCKHILSLLNSYIHAFILDSHTMGKSNMFCKAKSLAPFNRHLKIKFFLQIQFA
jgi:hypothetical protein